MKKNDTINLPKGWEIKKLGDIADIEYGYTDKAAPIGDLRYIRITDIDNEGLLSDKEKVYVKATKEAESFLLKQNDLLMARTGATFAKVLLYENIAPSVFASYLIRIKFKIEINNKFYWYFSKSNSYWEQANKLSSGAAQPQFNGNALKQVFFPFPKSLPEQHRIVSILDKSFSAIDQAKAHAEQNLKNAKELFESYLNSINADKVDLGSLVDITTGKLNANAAVENGKYPFFTCSREIYAIDNYAFDLETILLAGNNASGDFNVKHYKGKFNAYQRTYVITVKKEDKILYRYLYFQLLRSLKEFKEMSVGANTRFPKLGMIQDLEIPLPTLQEQQTIVHQLDTLRAETQKLEMVYQKKIACLEELKMSVLEKMFSGELLKTREGFQ